MITIKICEYERQFASVKDLDEQWINQQINRRKDAGESVCVRVIINRETLMLGLLRPTAQVVVVVVRDRQTHKNGRC